MTSDGWRYFDLNGVMQTGWLMDQGAWYHIGSDGLMDTGLLEDGGKYYFLRDSGAMATGWRMLGDTWYYFGDDGAMKTGWVGDDSAWYYLNPENGKMCANTQITVDGVVYNVDENGVCREVVPETESADSTDNTNINDTDGAGIQSAVIGSETSAANSPTPIVAGPDNRPSATIISGSGGNIVTGSATVVAGGSNAVSGIPVSAPFQQ